MGNKKNCIVMVSTKDVWYHLLRKMLNKKRQVNIFTSNYTNSLNLSQYLIFFQYYNVMFLKNLNQLL